MSELSDSIAWYFSRLPFLPIPSGIYVTPNDDVRGMDLYASVHRLRAEQRDQYKWSIYGMHRPGTDYIFLAGNAPETTAVHEAIHNMGVHSELLTRVLTEVWAARAKHSLGLLQREVKFREIPIPPSQSESVLRGMGLVNPEGGTTDLVLLVPEGAVPSRTAPSSTLSTVPDWYLVYHPELIG